MRMFPLFGNCRFYSSFPILKKVVTTNVVKIESLKLICAFFILCEVHGKSRVCLICPTLHIDSQIPDLKFWGNVGNLQVVRVHLLLLRFEKRVRKQMLSLRKRKIKNLGRNEGNPKEAREKLRRVISFSAMFWLESSRNLWIFYDTK